MQRARFANRLFWPTRTYQVCSLDHSRSRAPELAEELSTPESRARRKQELRSISHADSGVRRVFVGGGLASYRLQSAVRVDFGLPPVCLLTDSPPVPGSGGARPTTTLALPGSPFAASGPICSPRDGQMKQSRLHSCPFCMRQRPAELSANRQRDRQYDDSLSTPHYD